MKEAVNTVLPVVTVLPLTSVKPGSQVCNRSDMIFFPDCMI